MNDMIRALKAETRSLDTFRHKENTYENLGTLVYKQFYLLKGFVCFWFFGFFGLCLNFSQPSTPKCSETSSQAALFNTT